MCVGTTLGDLSLALWDIYLVIDILFPNQI